MKPIVAVAALFVVTAGVLAAYPYTQAQSVAVAPPPKTATASGAAIAAVHPKIEVVFVLDTTSSMGGLIQGAKDNIWSIASSMCVPALSPLAFFLPPLLIAQSSNTSSLPSRR